jgi:hypothetical protein
MDDRRQRPAPIKKTLQADAIQLDMLRRDRGLQLARRTPSQGGWHVFFDGDGIAIFVFGKVHNAEAADGDLLYNAVTADFYSIRQRCVGLNGHLYEYSIIFPARDCVD